METTGISLGDAMNLCNNGNYGNNAMWNNPIWALAFMRFMGGGYDWGVNRGGVATTVDLAQGLDNQDKNGQLRGIANGLADLGYALNNAVKDGNSAVAKEIGDVGSAMAMGFCNTNHNIDSLKYENAKNTSEIIGNATANTQKILDKMCAMELNAVKSENTDLRQQLADARLAFSQQAQNAYLIEKLTPAT